VFIILRQFIYTKLETGEEAFENTKEEEN